LIYVSGTVILTGCKFNNIERTSGNGGAIYVDSGGSLNVTNTTFTDIKSSGYGGAIYFASGGSIVVDGSSSFTGCTGGQVCGGDQNSPAIYVVLTYSSSAVIPQGNVYFSISSYSLPYDILYDSAKVCISSVTVPVLSTTNNDLYVKSGGSDAGFCDSSSGACGTITRINQVGGYFSHATLTVESDIDANYMTGT
jgi:hypothetical protein